MSATSAPDRDDDYDVAYDISEVCRRTKAGRSFIYAEIGAGRLRAIKLGRLTRILAADLRAWLANAPALAPATEPRPRRRCPPPAASSAR